jgi:hypothetical protein
LPLLTPMGSSIAEVELMFGPYSMNKALCGCGAIADLDIDTVRRKQGLGKRVECANCRNIRIAREKEILERHFLGLDEEEPEWTMV